VTPGEAVCVAVDWTMANELTLVGISDMYTKIGRPGVANKERVWLAVDHTVDPRNYGDPKPKALIKLAEEFAAETEITDFWRPNTTIMHTEFARQRAQPGQIVIGADSHTCSAGGMGALAIGLGAGDVVLPLVTGQTWLQVPETLLIEFVGEPAFGISGKDIILHVLGLLKRNTVANERAVEWRGPGLKYLSTDARFAIANMSTEFGGIAGVFEGDEQTARTLAGRVAHKDEGLYFRADADAKYADRYTIDLLAVVPQVALFPSPDNCRTVVELAAEGMLLDGAFIGACTTTQEELVLGALVLEAAMNAGVVPIPIADANNRRVTPGSRAITAYLQDKGLIEIYERAGFVVGAPGCSYCLGIAADVAGDAEVWLSSQNRNFKNRMGKGSIANLASAAVVAVSALGMRVTDPSPYLAAVDRARYDELRQWIPSASSSTAPALFTVTEPAPAVAQVEAEDDPALHDPATWSFLPSNVSGRVQRFGDMVDTDAIIPAQMMGCSPADMVKYGGQADMSEDEFLGSKAFAYVRPEFSGRVKEGATIVVAGAAFGCGSSREEAVRALKQAGVGAVIAKSFAFIYARNQPNLNLLGVLVSDERFYELAVEGATVEVDVSARNVLVAAPGGGVESFPFSLTTMEERFLRGGGVERLYKTFRKELFKALVKGPVVATSTSAPGCDDDCSSEVSPTSNALAW
jgi:homoaconitate hydratase